MIFYFIKNFININKASMEMQVVLLAAINVLIVELILEIVQTATEQLLEDTVQDVIILNI